MKERWSQHKTVYRRGISDCSSKLVFDAYGIENCTMNILEEVDSKEEALLREKFYIDNNICVNRRSAFLTQEDTKEYNKKYNHTYYETNKEDLKNYRRTYEAINREKINHRASAYYTANKEKISQQRRERYAKKKLSNDRSDDVDVQHDPTLDA
jgi:hypothetical protein